MAPAASARLGSCRPHRASQVRFTNTMASFVTNCRCAIHRRPWRLRSPMPAESDDRRIGVILAAGRGGRMGGNKQLTPWPGVDGSKPLVAASYDAIHSICDDMVVVLGHIADSVVEVLGDRRFHRAESD